MGSDFGQQVWKASCILVALRAWSRHWISQQTSLAIKSDNISALVMASRLKVTTSQLIARELAMTLSEAHFMPRHVVHVPRVVNVWADALSRLDEPHVRYSSCPAGERA